MSKEIGMTSGLWRLTCLVGVLGAAFALGVPMSSTAGAATVVPHRAVYGVSLGTAESSSTIIGVQGRMGFEWRDNCDGWSVDQRYAMEFSRSDGDASYVRSTYTTWESKAGDRYRFIVMRNRGDGEERVEGRATMPLPLGSAPGQAVFTSPNDQTLDLPADTLFPTEHTIRLIDAAAAGRRFLRAAVFDGSELEAPSLISAVLGKAHDDAPPIDVPALQGPYYPSRLAWFGPDGAGSEPDFEMSIDVLANGIARSILVEYDTFAIRMTLESLEVLPPPTC